MPEYNVGESRAIGAQTSTVRTRNTQLDRIAMARREMEDGVANNIALELDGASVEQLHKSLREYLQGALANLDN